MGVSVKLLLLHVEKRLLVDGEIPGVETGGGCEVVRLLAYSPSLASFLFASSSSSLRLGAFVFVGGGVFSVLLFSRRRGRGGIVWRRGLVF